MVTVSQSWCLTLLFQSLTRDSNHSNARTRTCRVGVGTFQSLTRDSNHSNRVGGQAGGAREGFNPSRGIAIIHTWVILIAEAIIKSFQSLTRDSNHSNTHSGPDTAISLAFQSLTRDSNHSNGIQPELNNWQPTGFNPSRGIAIIQTRQPAKSRPAAGRFQSLTRDSNHSNLAALGDAVGLYGVSIPHAG